MTPSEKCKMIISVLQRRKDAANKALMQARVTLAGSEAMQEAWERERRNDPNDMGSKFGNPYDRENEHMKQSVADQTAYDQECQEVLDYALEHFLSFVEK